MPAPNVSQVHIFVVKKDRFELLIDPQFNDLNKFGCRDDRFVVFMWIAIDNAVFALVRWSVLISLAQIFVLVALVVQYGTAPLENNPYFGPSVNVLIQFGAKDGELIIKDEEYWRLLSAIILHAGVYHLLGNIALQLLISGYLEHSWGVTRYFAIYFTCGIVGYMFSCCFLYDSVSVGSSGSIMGLLASWLFDILFALQKVRSSGESYKIGGQHVSVMLYSILTALLLTLATSWSSGVDWASHAGGCLYGIVWACALSPQTSSKSEASITSPSISHSKEKSPIIRIVSATLLFLIPALLLFRMILK